MDPIEIFRTGTHTAANGSEHTFSADDLQAIADGYDKDVAQAPIVVGHPKTDHPAYGWFDRLEVKGDKLLAHPSQVDADFAELVKAGRFKRLSSSFYRPDQKGNPKPGGYYLRHVGFLGAQAPAVKGLKQPEFAAEADEDATFEELSAPAPATSKREDQMVKKTDDVDDAKRAAELDERDKAQKAEREQLDKDKAEFAEQQAAARRAADKAVLDNLVTLGFPPGHVDTCLAFAEVLAAHDEPVDFAEPAEDGKTKTVKKPPHDAFMAWLGELPKAVDFAERSKAEGETVDVADAEAVADAANDLIAKEKARGKHLNFSEAVRRVEKKGAKA